MIIYAVGLGPGDREFLAPGAKDAILGCEVIVGYTGYMRLIGDLTAGKILIETGMTGEEERCEAAIREALNGKRVCVVSSGDSGIYGMAALLFELAQGHPSIEISVVPGITAAVSAAAILGAPLANDFAAISLSDLLTPWETIEKRLRACAAADIVICLYNPRSKKRNDYIKKACDIVGAHLPPETKCGYVRNAFRGDDVQYRVCTLSELSQADAEIDMFTTVIIGNSATRIINGRLVTSRGYTIE